MFNTRILPYVENAMGESKNCCKRNAKPRQVCYGRSYFHGSSVRFGARDPLFEIGLIGIQRFAGVDNIYGT